MSFSFPPLSYLGVNSFDVRKCVKGKIKGLIWTKVQHKFNPVQLKSEHALSHFREVKSLYLNQITSTLYKEKE